MPSSFNDIIDGVSTSLAVKAPVKAVALLNIALSALQTVNGVAVVAGDRVLVTNQTSAVDNGIYVVKTGDWERAKDFNGARDVAKGTLVIVVPNMQLYAVTTTNPIIGTTSINFSPIDVAALSSTPYGLSLLVLADAAALAATLVTPLDASFLTPAEGNAAYQPLNSNLAAIAALSTTVYGRSLLTLADDDALAAQVDSFFLTPTEGNAAYAVGKVLFADVRAIAGTPPATVAVLGNTTAGIGGGLFRWDDASTTAEDGGTIIKVTALTTGRYYRIYETLRSSYFDTLTNFLAALTTGKTGIIDRDYSAQSISIASKTDVTILMPSNTLTCSVQPAIAGAGDFGIFPTFVQVDACTRLRLQLAKVNGNGIACNGCTLQDCVDCDVDVTVTGTITYSGYKSVGGSGNRHKIRSYSNTFGTQIGAYQNVGDPENNAFADIISHDNVYDGILLCIYGGSVKVHAYDNGLSGVIFVGANGRSCRNLSIVGSSHDNNVGFQIDVVNNTSEEDFVRDITFNGVHAYENTAAGGYGLGLYNCRNVQVLGGSFYNNGSAVTSGDGISIFNAHRVRVIGTQCYDTRTGAARLQGIGIHHVGHVGEEDVHIEGNLCKNNLFDGVLSALAVADTCKGLAIVNNQTLGNGRYGVFVLETDVGSIIGAVISGNTSFGNTTLDMRLDILDVKGAEDNQYSTETGCGHYTLTDNAATPSIGCGRRTFRVANSGATTITSLPSGLASPAASVGPNGREIELYFTNANTGITAVVLGGAAIAPAPANGILTARRISGNWIEVARSF